MKKPPLCSFSEMMSPATGSLAPRGKVKEQLVCRRTWNDVFSVDVDTEIIIPHNFFQEIITGQHNFKYFKLLELEKLKKELKQTWLCLKETSKQV